MPPLPPILTQYIVKTDVKVNKSNLKTFCKPCIDKLGEEEGHKNFAITVLNDEQTHNPCFRCICDGKDSGTQLTATAAINNTYSQIFSNKTKYSGLAVMGFDNEAIVHDKIGVSSREGCYGAGPGYLSTLITKYADKRSLFVQSIEDECSLDIYNEGIKLYHNKDTTPNKIWETIGILKKYDGATLFGITDYKFITFNKY
ncbi:unnamed protein product [Rhizophagus irregularis]|uniref:N-terminal nucleophile aminohydrolase n=1 Tax=Rhizophagus irregularis TaxID=588596 RepID=A0A915YMW6_9GLOM|nr:unnamed protein product [Rhizophagus irregularis]